MEYATLEEVGRCLVRNLADRARRDLVRDAVADEMDAMWLRVAEVSATLALTRARTERVQRMVCKRALSARMSALGAENEKRRAALGAARAVLAAHKANAGASASPPPSPQG